MEKRTTKTCPYCGEILDPLPRRRKDCPHCGNHIRIRQGFFYTESDYEAHQAREEEAPSAEQMAFMINLGLKIPPGCTEEQATKILDSANFADTPTEEERESYLMILRQIRNRMKGDIETEDDIIANPPKRPRIKPTAGSSGESGCAVVLLCFLTFVGLTYYLSTIV